MQTKRTILLAALVTLVTLALVALFASAICAPQPPCVAAKADSFVQTDPTEFALRVFAGEPGDGFVDHLTLAQVQAIANTTVYVRPVFNQHYELCSTPTEAKAP